MELLSQMMLYTLLALTAENVIIAGGVGFSRVLRAARRPKTMLAHCGLVGGFTMISAWLGILLNPRILSSPQAGFFRPAVFAAGTAAVYLLAVFVYRTWWPKHYKKVEPIMSSAALNTVVLSMPFVQRVFQMNAWQAMGFALGTALAFLFAVLVLSQAMTALKNPDMPKAFRGLPAVFIYVGILSLAFLGFTSGRIF